MSVHEWQCCFVATFLSLQQKLDSRDSSAANSASGSPLPLRKHKDKSVRSKSDIPDHKVLITKLNRVQSEKDVVDGFSYGLCSAG